MATNGSRCSSENWAVFMDICDAINSSEEGCVLNIGDCLIFAMTPLTIIYIIFMCIC